ncbi:formimidoylglutamase [Cobetia sp. L2A1]|uniref:formimidoylglutamase n=1 Tax=Cobetia sp. L2A1 TaxID=2686360 RepID=UPI00131ABB75|nr:formimidoylglutamase [Cobetia sp. L2A1]
MVCQTPAPHWKGRDDTGEPSALSKRWHHQVMSYHPSIESRVLGQCAYALLGFACDLGVIRNQGRAGAADGPKALRRQLANLAWPIDNALRVCDYGNIAAPSMMDPMDEHQTFSEEFTRETLGVYLADAQAHLASHVSQALATHTRLLVIGGGHETAWGSFQGLWKRLECLQQKNDLESPPRLGIINLDAHLDLRLNPDTHGTSGTPFRQIADFLAERKQPFEYCCLGMAAEANTRGLRQRADDIGALVIEDRQLSGDAMNAMALEQARQQLANFCIDKDVLYLTLDLDVLPHYQAPGVSAPASRGVALSIIETLIQDVKLHARACRFGLPLVEVVELNPHHDQQQTTARTAAVLASIMLLD